MSLFAKKLSENELFPHSGTCAPRANEAGAAEVGRMYSKLYRFVSLPRYT
jgi:hypothetical protein